MEFNYYENIGKQLSGKNEGDTTESEEGEHVIRNID